MAPTDTDTDRFGTPTLADDQHVWDSMPHAVWDNVPITGVELYDILGQTLQVQGIAAGEHRGKPAIRFDVENVFSGGRGRVTLTRDNRLCDVKRYHDGPGLEGLGLTARQFKALAERFFPMPTSVTTSSVPPVPAANAGAVEDAVARAKAWAAERDDPDTYETDDAVLFSFVCELVASYARLIQTHPDREGSWAHEVDGVLEVIGENLLSS